MRSSPGRTAKTGEQQSDVAVLYSDSLVYPAPVDSGIGLVLQPPQQSHLQGGHIIVAHLQVSDKSLLCCSFVDSAAHRHNITEGAVLAQARTTILSVVVMLPRLCCGSRACTPAAATSTLGCEFCVDSLHCLPAALESVKHDIDPRCGNLQFGLAPVQMISAGKNALVICVSN